jgi:hypothetical protein
MKKARYVGAYAEVSVFDPQADCNQPPCATAKRGEPVELPDHIYDELTAGDQWESETPAKKSDGKGD